MKTLQELLNCLPAAKRVTGALDRPVKGIAYDSRKVGEGDAFFCIPGFKSDGHRYTHEARQKGADVFFVSENVSLNSNATTVFVPDTREALALVSAEFFGHPSSKLRLIGVTGTNGKTTTAILVEKIFEKAGDATGVLGTIFNKIRRSEIPTSHTTLESRDLQEMLASMAAENVRTVCMEVSSHALALDRVKGCDFDCGIFTNFTQDHLDFHQTADEYFKCKLKLFTEYATPKAKTFRAVVNVDDGGGKKILGRALTKDVLTYAVREDAHLKGTDIELSQSGTKFFLQTRGKKVPARMKLCGLFNVYNALAAAACGLSFGIDLGVIKTALEEADVVRGRLQRVPGKQPFLVVVDYAHTPDGLENVLSSVREFTKGRMIVVFGCGGDRDRTKRPKMGAIACRLADVTVLTSDNPRSEAPDEILKAIEEGFVAEKNANGKVPAVYAVETDRKTAIEVALRMAQTGDTVVLAGKGHETVQIFKDRTIHFDDIEAAEEILKKLYP